jgi:ankyrin repeat protein
VQYLLKSGADRDAKDNRGKTSMDRAVENNHVKVAEILGTAGATITLSKHSSWAARRVAMTTSRASDAALSSPLPANAETIGVRRKNLARSSVDLLVQACKRGDLATVQRCIAEEVNCDARGKFGQRPLHYACRDGENPEIVALLVRHGADCERKDEGGYTPLMVACHKGKASLVKVLLESGANADTTNHLGMTPLMVAAQLAREDIMELLFAQAAKLEAKCDQGRTALTYSVASRDIKVATFLLYKGAAVESRDDHGLTPLMHAARSGELRPVKLLLSWGADREAKDNRGLTAADHAKAKNFSELAKLLEADEKTHKRGVRKLFS